MYEDSNTNKIDMIGSYLILCYDINDEKTAKLMTIAKYDIDDISKSGPSNTIFLEFTNTFFGKESNKSSLKHNRTSLNVQDNVWYKDKFKIATKFIFFHLIYRGFESNEHVKRMLSSMF